MARIHRGDTTGRAIARLLASGIVTVLVLSAVAIGLILLVTAFVAIGMGLGL